MVQTSGYQDSPVNTPDPWALAQGSSIKSLPFSHKDQYGQNVSANPGTSFIGTVSRDLETSQERDFTTNELLTYDDGRPRWQIVVTLADTDAPRDPEDTDDDGTRRFFFKGIAKRALQDEMKAKKVQRFGVGTKMRITLVDLKPTAKGFPQKIYAVELTDIQPWVSPEQQRTDQALAPSQPVQQPQQVQGAQAAWAQGAPSGQAPQGQPVAQPQGQPVQQPVAQPVQQPQPAAVAQPVAGVAPTQEHITQLRFLTNQHVPVVSAIDAVALSVGQGESQEFKRALADLNESTPF